MDVDATEAAAEPRLDIMGSRQFNSWLAESDLSLAFTTYQTGKVFFIGLQPEGQHSIFERTFNRCMGMCVADNTLYMSLLYQLWRFENALGEGQAYDSYDRIFVLVNGHTTGDLERCSLRPGNTHNADGWRNILEPVVERYRDRKLRRYFRGDATFALPDLYEFLEAEGCKYTIRLKVNKVLLESVAHLLTRPVGRPPYHLRRFHASFSYQAGSWKKPSGIAAKVEWHPGELHPHVGFIITNLTRPADRVMAYYNQRVTTEQHIKEDKNAINWTRLSCRKFRNNTVRLQRHALAYNLANFMRTLALPKELEHYLLTTLREKLVNIGVKVASHGRYVTFQLAEVAVPRSCFGKSCAWSMVCGQGHQHDAEREPRIM